tara:strand:- start:1779 stop:1895 length:117 start_codon:yes stop_codon:yes gene_type:complete
MLEYLKEKDSFKLWIIMDWIIKFIFKKRIDDYKEIVWE